MKKTNLIEFIADPQQLGEEKLQELLDISRKYPFYATPLVVLSKYLKHHNGEGYEEILHKAALRVPDREWLHNLLHSPENSFEEKPTGKKSLKQSKETNVATVPETSSDAIEEHTPPDSQNNYIETETIPANELELNVSEIEKAEALAPEPEPEAASVELEEPTNEISPVENETISEAIPLETIILDDHTMEKLPVENDEEIFEEISDFTVNLGTEITPEIKDKENHATNTKEVFELEIPELNDEEELSIIESLEEIEGLLMSGAGVNIEPDIDHRPRPNHYSLAAFYDIENYFPLVKDTNTQPTDFYSWLSNPEFSAKAAEIKERVEEKKQRHEKLVNNFIETNPSISRPQKEFFNPVEAAKKSEHMPLDLATETLAKIYIDQKNFSGAIKIYKQLILKMPGKKTYFASQIKKVHEL